MPRITAPPPGPRVQVTGGSVYGLMLSVAEYAGITGQSIDSVYDSVRAASTLVPVRRLSRQRIAFSTVELFTLLGVEFEVIDSAAVPA